MLPIGGGQLLFDYGGLLAAGYGLYQTNQLHEKEHTNARKRYKEAIDLAKKQHENDLKVMKQTYLLEVFNSLGQHFQQLNADLIANSGESERDMFDQRNQSFQTIILSSSVMFGVLANMIVQGYLPVLAGDFIYVAYGLTSAMSLGFLVLSMVLCIELVLRSSSFMYKRRKMHTRNLKLAIRDTKEMMKELRGESSSDISGTSLFEENSIGNVNTMDCRIENASANSPIKSNMKNNSSNLDLTGDISSFGTDMMSKGFRRAVSRMTPNEVEVEFNRHEAQIKTYLKKREVLNDSTAANSSSGGDQQHPLKVMRSFKYFWEESCEPWWHLAIIFFYVGSVNLLLAVMVFMWAQYIMMYSSLVGAIIGVDLIGVMIIIGYALIIIMRAADRAKDQQENTQLKRCNSMSIIRSPSLTSGSNINFIEQSNRNNFNTEWADTV